MMKQATLREEGKGILVKLKLNSSQTPALFERTWGLGFFVWLDWWVLLSFW